MWSIQFCNHYSAILSSTRKQRMALHTGKQPSKTYEDYNIFSPQTIYNTGLEFYRLLAGARGFARIKILLKKIYYVIRQAVCFQVTGKNALSAMNNYNSQALKM